MILLFWFIFSLDSRLAATSNGSNSTLSHLSQWGDSSPENIITLGVYLYKQGNLLAWKWKWLQDICAQNIQKIQRIWKLFTIKSSSNYDYHKLCYVWNANVCVMPAGV